MIKNIKNKFFKFTRDHFRLFGWTCLCSRCSKRPNMLKYQVVVVVVVVVDVVDVVDVVVVVVVDVVVL